MTITLHDIEDAFLNARAKFKSWERDYKAQYTQPIAEGELMAVWHTLTPEQHAQMAAADPATYEQVKNLVDQLGVKHGRTMVATKTTRAY